MLFYYLSIQLRVGRLIIDWNYFRDFFIEFNLFSCFQLLFYWFYLLLSDNLQFFWCNLFRYLTKCAFVWILAWIISKIWLNLIIVRIRRFSNFIVIRNNLRSLHLTCIILMAINNHFIILILFFFIRLIIPNFLFYFNRFLILISLSLRLKTLIFEPN